MPTLNLSTHHSRLSRIDPLIEFGRVEKIVGNSIESCGPNVTTGCVCWLESETRRVPVEVVGFTNGRVISMPLGKLEGFKQGDRVVASGQMANIGMSEQLRGRVVERPHEPAGLGQRRLPGELRAGDAQQLAAAQRKAQPAEQRPAAARAFEFGCFQHGISGG